MGYRITYGNGLQKNKLLPVSKKSIKFEYLVIACVVFLALAFGSKYWRHLLPGDAQVTERALHELTTDLRDGESVSEAVTAFCREILDNA